MRKMFDWKKNSSAKRRISGIMAGVLVVTTIGAVTFIKSREVEAKVTLNSIEQVINSVKNESYDILEIVPDTVSFNSVQLNDIYGKSHLVSGDQIMGFTGYYIGGQEPVREDIKTAVNDSMSSVKTTAGTLYDYTESSLSDSNLRYEMADAMLSKLAQKGLLKGDNDTTRNRSLMTAPSFQKGNITHYNGYVERYESELLDLGLTEREVERLKSDKEGDLQAELGYYRLVKDYDGSNKLKDKDSPEGAEAVKYIDKAKGIMESKPGVSGNYIMSYDAGEVPEGEMDIASKFVVSYIKESQGDGYSLNSLKYKSALDGTPTEGRGDFDPALSYYDDFIIDTMSARGVDAEANTRAVFGHNEGAECGYIVTKNNELTLDSAWDGDEWLVEDGTPLYVKDGDVYVFAGYYGSTPELTLSMNSLSRNNVQGKNTDNDDLVARIESHYSPIALSEADDILVDIGTDDSSVDVTIPDEIIEVQNSDADAAPSNDTLLTDDEDADTDDLLDMDVSNDGEGEDDTSEGEEDDENTENDDSIVYYTLEFRYSSFYDYKEVYYTVLSFERSDAENGAEYYVDIDTENPEFYAEYDVNYKEIKKSQAIVNCDNGRGSIGLVDEAEQSDDDLDHFVFDYKKGKGAYNWKRTQYNESGYENARIYKIRGAVIFYSLNITNNEWFKQYVFDREPSECPDLKIKVKNIEVSKVRPKDITDARMVVFLHGDDSLCLGEGQPGSFTDYNKDRGGIYDPLEFADYVSGNSVSRNSTVRANDLSVPVYKKLIEKLAVNAMPVVGDYQIADLAENNPDKNIKGSWIYNAIRVLMLKPQNTKDSTSGFKLYYNNIGNELGLDLNIPANQFEPGATSLGEIGASVSDNNFCHFVNQNAYVYNMRWEKMAGGQYQNFVNLFMYTMAPISESDIRQFADNEPENGFQEVIDDINSENFFRIADNQTGQTPQQLDVIATQATALRYIIGFGNKRERAIKGKLRVLEIEPTNSFDLYIRDNGDEYNRKAYNSYGMEGHSYDTSSLSNTNKILYRNGTYESLNDKNKRKESEGKLYRRSGMGDININSSASNVLINLEGVEMELTRMSVAELVGHIDDLNARYDMIYIGMNQQLLNLTTPTNDDIRNGLASNSNELIADYNDWENMKGLVYTNVGDYKLLHEALVNDDSITPFSLITNSNRNSTTNPPDEKYLDRYNGNDITDEYVKRITEFIDASYPVIFDDSFYVNSSRIASIEKKDRRINTHRVDSASYMYLLANNVKEKRSVYTVSDINSFYKNNQTQKEKDAKEFFENLLNLAKPEIILKEGSPAEEATKKLDPADQESDPNNFKMYGYALEEDSIDGKFHMPFEFKIVNAGAASADSDYKVELFVDLNADGKYSSREKMAFDSVRANGSLVDPEADKLRVGNDYYAQVHLANTYEGVIPWRLVLSQADHPERRTNVTGYYTLKRNKPVEINVLQLSQRKNRSSRTFAHNSNSASGYNDKEEGQFNTWDMQKTAYRGEKYEQNPNPAVDATIPYTDRLKNGAFGRLLGEISDYYEVKITTVEADEWEKQIAAEKGGTVDTLSASKYYEALRKYDMLILGFADCYMGPTSDNATAAIEKFIRSERSVLFTHDSTSYLKYDYFTYGKVLNNWYWGYYFNKHVRNVGGMDRYGVMPEAASNRDSQYHPYDTAYLPGHGTREGVAGNNEVKGGTPIRVKGLTNPDISSHSYNTRYHDFANINGINRGNGQDGGGSGDGEDIYGNTVTKVNDGQITKFPFALHDSFTVTPTHYQYYQLDLSEDSDHDGENDLVVWYCISDSPTRDFDGTTHKRNLTDGGGDMYEMSPNDVRNNYYIYNKGNIVYTGVGHRKVVNDDGNPVMVNNYKRTGQSDIIPQFRGENKKYNMGEDHGMGDNTDEIKLFINTMIAAYQRGIREPILKAVSSYTDASATGYIYVAYDQEYNNTTGVMDSDVNLFFKASRSNYNTTDPGLLETNGGHDWLNIKFYWEATEQEKNAGSAVEIPPLSVEYDAANPTGYDDDNASGLYGIEVNCSAVNWLNGNTETPFPNTSCGADNIVDDRIYKVTVAGVNTMHSSEAAADKDNNVWYKYDASVSANSIKGKSLNNRRIIMVVTNDTYNSRTDIGRRESSIAYVTLTRAKMFMLE